jgi:PilZ domain
VTPEGLGAVPKDRDRRNKVRISMPFHAKVKGLDLTGNEFIVETVLDNISADGLYMRLVPSVKVGANLWIDVGLHTKSHVTEESPRFSVDGVVLRTEEKPGGYYGVAVSFAKVRFD